MTARYPGRCVRCRGSFDVGEDIERDPATQKWLHAACLWDATVPLDVAHAAVAAAVLPPDVLAAAIALTHPDRHPPERAAQANRVTAALLAYRERHAHATRGRS